MNWRQQVKILADKNIKGSNKSETSGINSYSVTSMFFYFLDKGHKIVEIFENYQVIKYIK